MADNFNVKDGSGATITKAAVETAVGVYADKVVLVNTSGAPITSQRVNLGADVVPVSIADTVDVAVTGTVALAALPAGTNAIGKVTVEGEGVTYTDRSGSITTGGAAQSAIAANAGRHGLMFQNTSAGDLRVSNMGAASATDGWLIKAGDLFIWPVHGVPVGAISVWGATTGQTFEAAEW